MTSHPDSALLLLQHYRLAYFRDSADMAAYALLRTQADDKNYIDKTNDSLISLAVRYYSTHGNDLQKAKAFYYLGRIYQNRGDDTLTIKQFLIALPLIERTKDLDLLCNLKGNIANVLWLDRLYEDSEPYYKELINFTNGDKKKLAIIYNKLGIINIMKNKPNLTKAKRLLDKALYLSNGFQDDYVKSDIYFSLGKFYIKSKTPDKATDYIHRSLNIVEDSTQKYELYKMLGETYLDINQSDSATLYLNKSLKNPDLFVRMESYRLLKQIAISNKELSESYLINERIIACNDSLQAYNHSNTIISSVLRTVNNHAVSKSKSLALLHFTFILTILIIIVLCVFSIRRYHTIRKIRRLRHDILEKERCIDLLRIDHINETKHNNDIHQLQCEIDNLKAIIDNLKTNLKQRDILFEWKQKEEKKRKEKYYNISMEFDDYPISKIISQTISNNRQEDRTSEGITKLTDVQWNDFFSVIDHIIPGYIDSLRKKSERILDKDIKICCLSRLNFTYSDIALLLNCTPQSISARKKVIVKLLGYDSSTISFSNAITLIE
jgi:tetratricopeptide (TPR) repeat protein